MLATRILLAIAVCFGLCDATSCFIEEQSTTPMKAYKVTTNVPTYRTCVIACYNDPNCVSASYSDTQRICHFQEPADRLVCPVPPFRRYVRVNQNCQGQDPGVPYARTNLTLEHGVDPNVPAQFLHAEIPVNLNAAPPVCPVRKLDGTQGPVLYLRGLDFTGIYLSFGINNGLFMSVEIPAFNSWRVDYNNGATPYPVFTFISAYCAEENPNDDSCPPLPPYIATTITGTATPVPTIIGACTGKTLYATVFQYSNPFTFNGNDAKVFCAGGFWLAGDLNHGADGHTYRIDTGTCGN